MSNLIDTLFRKNKDKKPDQQSSGMTKAISVIAAILLWMYVMGEINPEIDKEIMNVNLDYTQVAALEAEGLIVVDQMPGEISVTVKGRRSEVLGIASEDIDAKVDLSGYGVGQVKVPVNVTVPKNISLLAVDPLFAEVTIDQMIHQQKPIQAVYSGYTADGYLIGQAQYEVAEILVSGPKNQVDMVDRLEVNINVDGATGDIFTTLPVIPLNQNGMEVLGVTVEQQYVDVSLPVYPYKRVPIDVDVQVDAAEGYVFVSDIKIPAKVDIIGTKDFVDNLEIIEAEPVKLEGATETVEIPLTLIVPDGGTVVGLKSEPRVKIFIEEEQSQDYTLTYDSVEIMNLGESYEISFSDETISVKVTGPASEIGQINADNIRIIFDATDLEEGQYSNVSAEILIEGITDLSQIEGGKISFQIN